MSSIFACNTCGFNQPRKHNAVHHWVKSTKLSIGCLIETRVQEKNHQAVLESAFPGSQCLSNYNHHRLGRIWVVWSDEVIVQQVLVVLS